MTPIRKLLGEWHVFLLNSVRRRTWEHYTRRCENFFEKFPKKERPQDFDRCDVEDYRKWRAEEGAAASTVKQELAIVSSFWGWMMDMKGLHLLNPTRKRPYKFF